MGTFRGGLCVCVLVVLVCASGCVMFEAKPPEVVVPEYRDAQAAMLGGEYASAQTILKRYLEANPKSKYRTDVLVLLGECAMYTGDFGEAQRDYQEAQHKPRTKAVNARAKTGLGNAMMAQQRFREAIQAYKAALKLSRKDIRSDLTTFYLARAYMRVGDWGKGTEVLNGMLADYPDSPVVPQAQDILKQVPNTFWVQVAACASIDGASAAISRLQRQGHKARIFRRNHYTTPYAVRVGSFSTYNAARAELRQLKVKGFGKDIFIVP